MLIPGGSKIAQFLMTRKFCELYRIAMSFLKICHFCNFDLIHLFKNSISWYKHVEIT